MNVYNARLGSIKAVAVYVNDDNAIITNDMHQIYIGVAENAYKEAWLNHFMIWGAMKFSDRTVTNCAGDTIGEHPCRLYFYVYPVGTPEYKNYKQHINPVNTTV